MAVEIRKP